MEGICLGQVLNSFRFYQIKAPKIQVLIRSCMMIQSWRENMITVSALTLNEELLQKNIMLIQDYENHFNHCAQIFTHKII